jgi:hypothetical protein
MESEHIIEKKLKEKNSHYYDMYEKMKNEIDSKYNDEIRIKQPWFTDHGIKHCNAILDILDDMIFPFEQQNITDVRNERKNIGECPQCFSDEDIFILLASTLWHDIGMLIERSDHGKHLIEFNAEILKYVNDNKVAQTIYNVACAHSSNKKFFDCANYNPLKFYDKKVYVAEKTLAAILRIADEISEDKNRITLSPVIFNNVPVGNKLFWEHAASISYSAIDNNNIHIKYEIDANKIFTEYEYAKDSSGNPINKTLYDFIIERICKILNELTICSPYFSNICRLDALDITIEVQKQKDWICEEIITYESAKVRPFFYPNLATQTIDFYNNYKKFSPVEIRNKMMGV